MESYLILDISILFFVVLSAFFSFMRGFSQEFLALLTWVISFFGSYKYGDKFVNVLNKIIERGKGQIELMEDVDDWGNVV